MEHEFSLFYSLKTFETLTRVTMDVSNRPYLIWKVKLKVEKLGEMDTELFKEWFQAFSQAAGITLHISEIMPSISSIFSPKSFANISAVP